MSTSQVRPIANTSAVRKPSVTLTKKLDNPKTLNPRTSVKVESTIAGPRRSMAPRTASGTVMPSWRIPRVYQYMRCRELSTITPNVMEKISPAVKSRVCPSQCQIPRTKTTGTMLESTAATHRRALLKPAPITNTTSAMAIPAATNALIATAFAMYENMTRTDTARALRSGCTWPSHRLVRSTKAMVSLVVVERVVMVKRSEDLSTFMMLFNSSPNGWLSS